MVHQSQALSEVICKKGDDTPCSALGDTFCCAYQKTTLYGVTDILYSCVDTTTFEGIKVT
jgi:hypothetical protein